MAKFRGYTPGEQPRGDWLKLNTNENPYEPPAEILQDLKDGLVNLRKYPDIDAVEVKKQLTFNIRLDKTHSLKMDNIVFGSGEDELLDILFKIFVDKDDKVVYFTPSYGMYKVLCNIYEGKAVEIPLNPDFSVPVDKASAAEGKIMFICSPNNPNGARVPNEVVDKICSAFEGIVVVDEAYVDFAEDNCLSLALKHDNLIILRTFSKSYSLAALRVGYLISLNRDVILAIRKTKLPYNVNLTGQVAALASLKHQKLVDENVQKVKSERDRLVKMMAEIPQIKVFPSEANFIFIKIEVGDDSKNMKINQKIFWELKKRKILVRQYPQRGLYEYQRITVGKPEDNDRFIKEFKECLEIGLQSN